MAFVERADDTRTHDLGAPLTGRSVLVTRTREQAAALVDPIEALGAEVLCFPVIEVAEPADPTGVEAAIAGLEGYDWLVITSTNGVDRFFDRLEASGGPSTALEAVRVAAVGSATARRMRERGVEPDLVPSDFRAEGLIEAFGRMGVAGNRILIARAEEAREVLPEQLRAMGADVEVVVTYRVVLAPPDAEVARRLDGGTVDIATFASGGTFKHFLGSLACAGLDAQRIARSLAIASVGPVTSEVIRDLGYDVEVEASESTMDSLVEAIVECFGGRG